ncbi:MAG TPA: c-type cytochrome [Anaerolineales bacterium]|nr:c-type cytochrome [Anaerolineales bacterium]
MFLTVAALTSTALVACAAGNQTTDQTARVEGGDSYRGAQAIQRNGCHSCHRIPGIRGTNSYVGPPLNAWSERQYIAGNLENNPENLISWIMNPQAIEPGTAMPNMNIDEQQARDIAAYLYTLQAEDTGLWSQGE